MVSKKNPAAVLKHAAFSEQITEKPINRSKSSCSDVLQPDPEALILAIISDILDIILSLIKPIDMEFGLRELASCWLRGLMTSEKALP